MDIIGILVLVISFFFLLVAGVPVAYSIGVAGILTMLVNIDSLPALTTYAMRMASGLDSFALLAIPFFILAGNIMNSGGIALRLIDFAKVLVGRLPGGLAVVNVVANMLFGAISGSAAAAASAIGSIMTPEMKKAGYDPNFSAAVNISSATTGMTIPPSNVLIVYSLASGGVSVSALFMAGYLPGILTGVAIMIVAAMFAARKGYPVGVRVPFSEATRVFFRAIPSLMLLVIVIGGILAGLFTATEASAIAVLYALILSFIYKELTWAKLPQVLLRSAKTTAIVLLLVATCTGLSWIMSYENIPQTVSAALLSISDNPVVILILINVILLIVGIFMDMTPAVLIFTPIFLPIATGQLGMDPVIGEEFIRVFEEEAKKIGAVDFLAQGTIYPDVVESGLGGESTVIKSHHNVGGLPDCVDFKEIIEPLRRLFKDEVRQLGIELGLPEELVWRQPFPGPGLAIRVIGEITEEKLSILREADAIFREEMRLAGLDRTTSQYFAALTNMRSVGVMGDERTYDYAIALRAVQTQDFMTATWSRIDWELLDKVSSRIVGEVKHINRVLYDITSKPPATVEFE